MTAPKNTDSARTVTEGTPVKSKSQAFSDMHLTKVCGLRYNPYDADCEVIADVQYGALRSAYVSRACNYSYREFWV